MTQEYKFDLHVHSVYSDGMYTFQDLVKVLKARGIQGFAITDHNCSGPLNKLEKLANDLDISLVKGVELKASIQPLLEEARIDNPADEKGDSQFEPVAEIICYGLDPSNKEFLADSVTHLKGKIPYLKAFCELIADLRVGEVNGLENHPRQDEKIGNLFQRLYEKKLSYYKGDTPPEGLAYIGTTEVMSYFIKKFGLDKPNAKMFAYRFINPALKATGIGKTDPFYGTDIRDIIKKAKRYGRIAVLAHPLTKKRKNLVEIYDKLIIPELVCVGLDGIELSYPEHNEEDEEIIRSWKNKFGLTILTGGSDFHKEEEIPNLGKSGVNLEIWNQLLELIK